MTGELSLLEKTLDELVTIGGLAELEDETAGSSFELETTFDEKVSSGFVDS